jgi:hypothetical protein
MEALWISETDVHVKYLMKNDCNVEDFHNDFVSSLKLALRML